jgi:hypothetical protein
LKRDERDNRSVTKGQIEASNQNSNVVLETTDITSISVVLLSGSVFVVRASEISRVITWYGVKLCKGNHCLVTRDDVPSANAAGFDGLGLSLG